MKKKKNELQYLFKEGEKIEIEGGKKDWKDFYQVLFSFAIFSFLPLPFRIDKCCTNYLYVWNPAFWTAEAGTWTLPLLSRGNPRKASGISAWVPCPRACRIWQEPADPTNWHYCHWIPDAAGEEAPRGAQAARNHGGLNSIVPKSAGSLLLLDDTSL